MSIETMETVLERLDGVRKFISHDVTEILDVLKSSTSLLDFLEEVVDEDIRNLIDAVEEHSEQYVRESTVSDLIEVKRFFYPILKKTYGDEFAGLFSLLQKQLTSGFTNMPAKIHDCMENLHTLKALYKNVANRGERTKEIIDGIVTRGKFSFRMEDNDCEIFVKYKQDKKTVSHNGKDLYDLRSRAFLLINAEDRDKNKQKTNKRKEDLEQFLIIVDTAIEISNTCISLKQRGHFDYAYYDCSYDQKELANLNRRLKEELNEWIEHLIDCRRRYYYLNFIHPAQLQQLFGYLCRNVDNERIVRTCLQFIDSEFVDVSTLKTIFNALPKSSKNNEVLANIAVSLQKAFEDYSPKQIRLSLTRRKAKITDIVQEGVPYIAALTENSPLVIRVMLALYMNTTNMLPDANQVLLCRPDTTFEEIYLFIGRCTEKPSHIKEKRLYCLAYVENLPNDVQNEFVEMLQELTTGDYLLAIICCGHSHHSFLDNFSDSLRFPTPITESMMKDCLQLHWPNVLVLSSDVPGLGKTETIHNKAREMRLSVKTLNVSGEVDNADLIQNLHSLHLRSHHVLHIDVGVTNTRSALDSALFQLIVLGYLSAGVNAYSLDKKHIFIEIANTVGQSLCNSLPITTCFPRMNITWDYYQSMKVSMELNSPVQVVCHYLKALESGILDRTDIYLTGCDAPRPLKADECILLLEKYFSSAGDMSYTMLQIFTNVLSNQLQKLSSSVFFRTASISAMIGEQYIPTVKSSLVKALVSGCQEFASRSVQSCRSLQSACLVSNESYQNLNSAEKLAQRVAGMIRWEDSNHLMVLFHQNLQTVSALYRDKRKIPLSIRTLFESQMKKTLDDFKTKSQKELQNILQMLTRKKPTKLSEIVLERMSSDYALTPDNLLKMVLISLRIDSNIPVVIMGETGCGKTSLVHFLANMCDIKFEVMNIHAGINEEDVIRRVKEINEKAKVDLHECYWLFLDEINTCDHLGVINSIISHKCIYGKKLAPNVTVLAACNPYRLRTHSTILTAGLKGKVKSDELSKLVYRVHPLPEALIDFVWDYGSLHEKDEKFYIAKMVKGVFDGHFDPSKYEKLLTDLLAMSQHTVRGKEQTDSCVSLRDVDRCKKLVIWFSQFLQKKATETTMECGIEIKAVILALAVTYHSRFSDIETRKVYRQHIAGIVSQHSFIISPTKVLDIILDEQKDILDRMVLPNGIAKNTALQENVFVVLICILNKIPIFLVGKPGCSKSLSIQLIRSNLRGKDSKDRLFQNMPQLFCVSFQGSESSTSDGIIKVFEKAENYQKHNDKEVISVVILDEIGLAEVSRFNPLKVLHGLLEPNNQHISNVAVVGISNWALDAAKMNRAVHISRPDMDLEELKYTGFSIIIDVVESLKSYCYFDFEENNDEMIIPDILKHTFHEIAVAYNKYVSKRQKFSNFHGLRDYYSLMKYIGRCIGTMNSKLDDMVVLKGISRNFGGLPTEMSGIIEIFQQSFPTLPHKYIPVTELIKGNLNDVSCRHLMLITNGDAVISVLESYLNETHRPFEIIFGSHFDDDLSDDYSYRMLSRIILCMEQGLVLILKGLETIYGSLYDMLNQNYTIVGNKKNCRIALGHYSNPMCHVHDSFKCIVLVEESKLDYSDPPFLNRFEKQQFRFSDLIEDIFFKDIIDQLSEICDMLCDIEGCMFTPHTVIPSYSHDLLVSLILHLQKREQQEGEKDVSSVFLDRAISLMLLMIPPEVMMRAKESRLYSSDACRVDKMSEVYMQLPIHNGISHCLNEMVNLNDTNDRSSVEIPNGELLLMYTYTNIHCNIKSCLDTMLYHIEKLASFKSEKQLTNKMEDFFSSTRNVLILQCNAKHDIQYLLLSKVIIEHVRRRTGFTGKHVCIVIHLDRHVSIDQQHIPINYLSGWKICFLDSLERPQTTVPCFMNSSKFDIIQDRRPLSGCIKENLFWALTRIKFTEKGNYVENHKRLIEQLGSNEVFILTLEEKIVKWIEQLTGETDDQWCVEVAKNCQELYKSGSLADACENSTHDMIKTPLAMYVYRILELQISGPCFVTDSHSPGRIQDWKNIVLSDYLTISDMPPLTGPECFTCSASVLEMKMPLSTVIMSKVNAQKNSFIDIIRKIRVQNEIEFDEEIPFELFRCTVSKFTDIICCDADEIYSVQYDGRADDYISDFSNVHSYKMNKINDLKDNKGIQTSFKWALSHFIPTEILDMEFTHVIALVHAAFWLNEPVISSICRLIEISNRIFTFSFDNSTDESELSITNSTKEIDLTNMNKAEFVDTICLKLLPTEDLVEAYPMCDWVGLIEEMVPVAKVVTYDSTTMPAIQLCQDIVSLLMTYKDTNIEQVCILAKILQENDGVISAMNVFDSVNRILKDVLKSNKIDSALLQKMHCSYLMRCLRHYPEDDNIFASALKLISRGDVFDPHLSYFGKCIEFVLLLDQSENTTMIADVILNELDEVPPYVECLDNYLKTLDLSEDVSRRLPCLMIDVIQKSYLQPLVQLEDIVNVESISDKVMKYLQLSFDVISSQTVSFRFIVAVAFIKQFLEFYAKTLEDINFDSSKMTIVSQHVNTLMSSKLDEYGINPLLIYFMKIFVNHYGMERIQKRCSSVGKILTCCEEIKWEKGFMESGFVLNPLALHEDVDLKGHIFSQINAVLNKDHKLQDYLINECNYIITLFAIISQRFYMRRCLKELNDEESRMAIVISKLIQASDIPFKCKHMLRHLLNEEFGHEMFALSEASESPLPELVSITFHMCCLVAALTDDSNIWFLNLHHPNPTTVKYLPCLVGTTISTSEDRILKIISSCVLLGSIGFHFTTEEVLGELDVFTSDPSSYLQSELLLHFQKLEFELTMNSSDLCILLHCVIFRCEKLFTKQNDLLDLQSSNQADGLILEYRHTIQKILENRWKIIHDLKQKYYHDTSNSSDCIEVYIEETGDVTEETFLLHLFRTSRKPTKQIFLNELQLGSNPELRFLRHVFRNTRILSVQQFLPDLLSWHISVLTYSSYRFRKVDFKDLTVQTFLSQETDDKRRNNLKKSFEQFRRAWNEIKDKYVEELKDDITENMVTMNTTVRMESCIVLNEESILQKLIVELVEIHNVFLTQSLSLLSFNKETGSFNPALRTVSVFDIKSSDVMTYAWKDGWLLFSQCDTECGLGRNIQFDFDRIGQEIQNTLILGKAKLACPLRFPRPVFIDDLFQNSVELLDEIESVIHQQSLTSEIKKSVQRKVDRDSSFVTNLLSHLGMVISLLKKTGGDNTQPLIEYLENWQSVTGMNSNVFKRILPEPIDAVKLGHVITLYKWLEELNGMSLVETLDVAYNKQIPREGEDILQKVRESHLIHLEKLQHPLLVFVHRCLAVKQTNINVDHALIDYIISPELWWKGDLQKRNVVAGKDNKVLPLREILSPQILVEHICQTTQFVQDAVKEAREGDVRISSITSDFQKSKTTASKSRTRKTVARRFMDM